MNRGLSEGARRLLDRLERLRALQWQVLTSDEQENALPELEACGLAYQREHWVWHHSTGEV
jgi:hypothetical protein